MSAFKVGELMTPDSVGSMGAQDADAVAITGGSIAGITDLAVADGGTGSGTAGGARTNLGLGTIATQASNNVAVTGGAVSGTALTVQSFDVAGAPSATLGRIIHVTNGDGGSECMAIGDGSYFRVILMGSTIST